MTARDGSKRSLVLLKESIQSTLLYKYLFLILLLGVVGFFTIYDFATKSVNMAAVSENILSGTVASIILSIIYDLFTKRQQDIQSIVDREEVINELSREVFLARGVTSLTQDDIYSVTKALTSDDRFLAVLANLTSAKAGYASGVLEGFFKPLWRTSGVEFHAWENHLLEIGDAKEHYLWKSRQRLQPKQNRETFRVGLTDRTLIGARMINGPVQFDSVLVVDDIGAYPDADSIRQMLSLRISGKRGTTPSMCPLLIKEELSTYEELELSEKDRKNAKVIEFSIPEKKELEFVLDFQFSVKLSLKEPCFYVQADDLCFVSELVIDYNGIKRLIGKVWPVSFVGNSGAVVDHDSDSGRIIARIDGPLMPGQGIALVWRMKEGAAA